MENNNKNRQKKLLTVLIAIGIIAILASSYIKYLEPYATELSERDRDLERIEKLSLIDSALTRLKDTNSDISLGEINRVYVSIPSYSANCSGLNLPSLPDDWEYRCRSKTDFQKIDGAGWMPVDFTKISDDFDFEYSLPIDPVNTSDSGYYYAYVVGENNDWVLISLLESDKYLKETALKDGGSDPARIEIGSNLQLWAKPSGLVGYWNFEEGEGDIAKDLSGEGNDETLINGPTRIDGKVGKALNFDGVDDYVNCGTFPDSMSGQSELTVSFWAKKNVNVTHAGPVSTSAGAASNRLFTMLDSSNGGSDSDNITFSIYDGIDSAKVLMDHRLPIDTWEHVVFVFKGGEYIKSYSNGVFNNENTTDIVAQTNPSPADHLYIGKYGGTEFNGLIDEVRIYDKILNDLEVLVMYNAEK